MFGSCTSFCCLEIAVDAVANAGCYSAQGAVNLVVSHIYPIRVVSVSADGIAMLNYGSSMLQAGDILNIYELGEKFIDPDTGEGC